MRGQKTTTTTKTTEIFRWLISSKPSILYCVVVEMSLSIIEQSDNEKKERLSEKMRRWI